MAEMTYFQFFADHARYLEPFGDEERGRLLSALTAYAFEGREIELPGNERYIWPVFRRMVDQSRASLEKKQAAGAARARAAASESQRAPAKPSGGQRAPAEPPKNRKQEQEQEQEKEHEHEQEQEQEQRPREARETRETREKVPSLPPTPDEVKAFAKENALTIDAERFCNYYAARGWQSRGDPIRDWRPIVRNWAATEGKPAPAPQTKVLSEQRYSQREYTDNSDDVLDAMMADWMKRNPERAAPDPPANPLIPPTPNEPKQGGTT